MTTTTAAAKVRAIDSLECTSVSGGMNGCPTPAVGRFYHGFSTYSEAEAFAKAHGGEPYSMFKRDGWHVVNPDHYVLKPYNIQAEQYGDDYIIVDSLEEMKEQMMWYHDDLLTSNYATVGDLKKAYHKANRNYQENKDFDFSTKRLVLMNHGEGDLRYYSELSKECLHFHHDTKHYIIGVWIQ
jgi:hypothetical protein